MPAPTDILRQVNWIDILSVIVLFRITYIAVKLGVIQEFFKLLGTLLGAYASLHYYRLFAGQLENLPGIGSFPESVLTVFSCISLALSGYLLFRILHFVFSKFVKTEPAAFFNKWGGLLLGICRGCLLAGLILFIMAASGAGYLRSSIRKSYTGERLFLLAPAAYSSLWNGVVSHFVPGEKFNEGVNGVKKSIESRR
ncbi:MAG: CvpA family protein [Candidatus Omnitrophica bacterium]|nr:CvpA family protein [Candidatus Omnitrophota bacterium]